MCALTIALLTTRSETDCMLYLPKKEKVKKIISFCDNARCSPTDLDGDCRADKNPNDKSVLKRVTKRKKSNRKSYLIVYSVSARYIVLKR